MAVLKYKDGDGNYQDIVGINVQNEVVQTTGNSTTSVMSQKAATDSFYTKSQVDAKVAFSYDPTTKGMVFPTDTSIVEYDATTKGMIFH